MTSYTLRKGSPEKTRTDLVVVGLGTRGKGALVPCPGAEAVADAYGRKFEPLLASLGFRGGAGEAVRFPTGDVLNAAQLLVVGLGEADAVTPELVRRAAGVAARNIGNAASVAVALPAEDSAQVQAIVEGFRSGLYRFDAYKSGGSRGGLADVVVLSEAARRADVVEAVRRATVLADAVDLVRDWVNTPPNDLVPERFAEEVLASLEGTGVHAEVHDAEKLASMGAGGILGVGLGSDHPPCLVKLSWRHETPRASIALVGKGITYDTGGLTIKPASSMPTMKSDMAGAAAVAAAVRAIAALELPVAVTAYLPMAENMISGSAMRPGDVLTTLSGRTVEVLNTDAEGRLIMADALTLATRDEPDVLLDVATLTGHMVTALGDRVAALFGDDDVVALVQQAAEATGEMFWRMPIPEEQRGSVRRDSKVADLLQHNLVRWGGGLYAAAFLEVFTEGRPWGHLDIAGPAYNGGGPWGHVPSGGTGFGVRTVVEAVRRLAER